MAKVLSDRKIYIDDDFDTVENKVLGVRPTIKITTLST